MENHANSGSLLRCLKTYGKKKTRRNPLKMDSIEWREKYSLTLLEQYSYRQLQKIAKEMTLPSNVKKVYLIKLIHTKVFGSQNEIYFIMQQIKLERLQKTNARIDRNRHWAQQLVPQEPPICPTPKLASENPPLHRSLQYVDQIKTYSYNERVLRNRSNRSQTEMYGVMNVNNTIIGVLKTEEKPPKNLENAPLIKIYHDSCNSQPNAFKPERAIMPTKPKKAAQKRRHDTVDIPIPPIPTKRTRRLSGIYPITTQQPVKNYVYDFVDGTLMIKDTTIRVDRTTKPTVTVAQAETQTEPRNLSKRPNILSSTQNCSQLAQNFAKTAQNCTQSAQTASKNYSNLAPKSRKTDLKNNASNAEKRNLIENNCIDTEQFEQPNCTIPLDNTTEPLIHYTESMENCAHALLNLTGDKENRDLYNNTTNDKENSGLYNNTTVEKENRDLYNNNITQEKENTYDMLTDIQQNSEPKILTPTNNSLTYTRNTQYIEQQNFEEDYYHKKIRAGQVKNRRESRKGLPRIEEVFTQFGGLTAGGQTPYVTLEEERFPVSSPDYVLAPPPMFLEAVYTLRAARPKDVPTANTRTVYTTPVCVTAAAQESIAYGPCPVAMYEPASEYYQSQNGYNYFQMPAQDAERQSYVAREQEAQSSSTNTSTTTQVEDALELISQDGDYMERIGMDVRVPCIFCNWEGPRIILEKHILKEHAALIHSYKSLWAVRCSLAELEAGAARVCAAGTGLLLLRAILARGSLRARLAYLAPEPLAPQFATITTYNRVTGEAHSWQGEVPSLDPAPFASGPAPSQLIVSLTELGLYESADADCPDLGVVLFVKL